MTAHYKDKAVVSTEVAAVFGKFVCRDTCPFKVAKYTTKQGDSFQCTLPKHLSGDAPVKLIQVVDQVESIRGFTCYDEETKAFQVLLDGNIKGRKLHRQHGFRTPIYESQIADWDKTIKSLEEILKARVKTRLRLVKKSTVKKQRPIAPSF